MDFPPDWMLVHGAPRLGVVEPKYYDALASYFANYVAAYEAQGVHIDFLEAFNEPFDSYTQMRPSQLATFLGKHLGPEFERRGLWPATQLTYGGQCSRESAGEFVPVVMSDAAAAKYMDVIAYHGYDCQYEDDGSCTDARQRYDVIAALAAAYPDKPLWMTEICYAYNGDDPNCTAAATMASCTDYPRDPSLAPPLPRTEFADGTTWGHRIVKELQSGAGGWIYWNMLLDARGGPFAYSPAHGDAKENWQQPVVVVDTATGGFRPTGLFYFLAHFSRFVRPGAVRVGTQDAALPDAVSAVAFTMAADAAASTVLQLVNRGPSEQHVAVCSGGRVADLVLPAASITTAQWGSP